MIFDKFQDFLDKKVLKEEMNKEAHDFSKRLAVFNQWVNDRNLSSEQLQEMLKKAGYQSVAQFVSENNDRKYSALRIPGQGNYTEAQEARVVARVTVPKRANEHGEWVVLAYDQYGKRLSQADYFGDSKLDAEQTAATMVKKPS